MSPERKLLASEAQWVVQSMARLSLTVAVALGILIIVGGRVRWSSPSYETALTYPYAPASWGYIIGLAGIVGLLASLRGHLRTTAASLFITGTWAIFFAISFVETAARNENAATTGIPVYFGLAITSCLIGVAHWRSARHAVQR